jgi:Tfp pilus assembly protein PilX
MITFRLNRKTRNRNRKRRQRGVALIAALLTLVLISAITAGMIILSTTETSISSNFRDEQTAFFSAKAGIEEVRDRLWAGAPNTLRVGGLLPTAFPGAANGVLYILNPATPAEVVAPWNGVNFPDDEICKETNTVPCATNAMGQQVASPGGWYQTTTSSGAYAAAPILPWKWARLTLKQNNSDSQYATNGNAANAQMVCWNGTNEYADPNPPAVGCTPPNLPVYILTALAVTPTGTRRMIQAEMAENKYPFTAPSALTMDGHLDTFSGGASNQWGVSGNDSPGCGVAAVGPPVHAIGVLDPGDVGTVDAGVKRNSNVTSSIPGAPSPDVVDVSSLTGNNTLPANLSTVSALQTMVSTMKANATQPVINGPASGLSNPGTLGNPQIIYVNGDLSISGNTQGYGILVVTGTLNISGNVGWNGIVLVVGKGIFNTSGTAQYNGAVVVANTVDALGNPLPTVGPSQVNVNGGGHGGFQYSSGCINIASQLSSFHIVAIRELLR